MYCVPIYRDKFTVVVPENHPLAANSTVTVEELMDEPLIVSKGRYELSIMALFKEKGIEPIFKYEFNHPDTALNFIRQGLGIALLPELTLKATTGKLCSVALEPTFLSTNFPVSKRTAGRRKSAIFITKMYGNTDR